MKDSQNNKKMSKKELMYHLDMCIFSAFMVGIIIGSVITFLVLGDLI